MSFAVVQSSANGSSAATTSHTVTMPSGVTVGDLLVIFYASDGVPGGAPSTPSGWTKVAERVEDSGAAIVRMVIFSKIATGADTFVATSSSSVAHSYTVYRILTEGTLQVEALVDGVSANPNPPSLTPSGGSRKYMWITAIVWQSAVFTSYPTNYSSNQQSNTAVSYDVASATYNLETATQDPGTFTLGASDEWIAATVAIEPQTLRVGTAPFLTSTSSILQPAINFAADGTFGLITMSSDIIQPTTHVSNITQWTNPDKTATPTWSNPNK